MEPAEHNKKLLWITWEHQTRNRSMAKYLSADLHVLTSSKGRVFRYLELSFKTIVLLIKSKPNAVVTQNPSIVLSLLTVLMAKIFKFFVVVDAHNAGIYPASGKNKILSSVARFIAKNANLTIVTNSSLADQVESWGGQAYVMPDPPPEIASNLKFDGLDIPSPYVFCILSWAEDEPVREIIKAAEIMQDEINFLLSGNYKKFLSDIEIEGLPKNIILPGFLSEEKFFFYLKHANAAIDLTNREDCLVCGAYECMSLLTPCVITDLEINREIFKNGYVYTKNNPLDISKSIHFAIANQASLANDLRNQLSEHQRNSEENAIKLLQKIFNVI